MKWISVEDELPKLKDDNDKQIKKISAAKFDVKACINPDEK